MPVEDAKDGTPWKIIYLDDCLIAALRLARERKVGQLAAGDQPDQRFCAARVPAMGTGEERVSRGCWAESFRIHTDEITCGNRPHNAQDLLALVPDEVAGVLLEYINSFGEGHLDRLNRYNLTRQPEVVRGYDPKFCEKVRFALMEAWIWLEREGIIAPNPDTDRENVFVNRRGRRLKDRADLASYRKANLLPSALLHPQIIASL